MEIGKEEEVRCSGEFDEEAFAQLLSTTAPETPLVVQCVGSDWLDIATHMAKEHGRGAAHFVRAEQVGSRLPDGGYIVQSETVTFAVLTTPPPVPEAEEPKIEDPEVDPFDPSNPD